MKRKALVAAIAVVLVSNIIALIGVARNRAGEPWGTIELTERELPLLNTDRDNTGIDLRFNWSRGSVLRVDAALDRSKLEQIGFSLRFPAETPASDISLLPREAYVVLEYQGNAWKQWLIRMEDERRQIPPSMPSGSIIPLPTAPLLESRLFVVDAARSYEELRTRHPDRSTHLIVRGIVRARQEDVKDPRTGAITSHNYVGFVSEVLPASIHVPLPSAGLLSLLKPRQPTEEPRYSVTLSYGRYLEPWVASLRLR